MKAAFALILFAVSCLATFSVQALGSGGCGSCGDFGVPTVGTAKLPTSIESEANDLREDFNAKGFQELLDQQILGTLCENNNCGKLSEEQASRILDRAILSESEQTSFEDRSESKWWTRIGALISAIGLILSYLAFRKSNQVDRQTVRNTVEIEHLSREMNPEPKGTIT